MSDAVPAGWTGVFNTATFTLSPGASNPVIIWVTAPAGTASGTYTVSAAASNAGVAGYSASASGTETIYTTPTCSHANPSLTVSGPSNSVAPGTTANFTVVVANHDSSACSASTFAMSSAVPAGWTGTYSTGTLTLSAGTSTSIILGVIAPSGTANGTYTVSAAASNATAAGYSASASGAETIYTQLPVTLAVSSSQTVYTIPQRITVNITALNGAMSASGVAVAVNLVKANGNTVTLSGTTGSDGVAAVTYQTKKNEPRGTWRAVAHAGAASASVTFIVQ
jgi:uncharacterized protein YfaS (alpha-2-macroglobulin family)